ncbi:hypothetical protein ABID92_001374 [Frigoribacterium sp. PvP120]
MLPAAVVPGISVLSFGARPKAMRGTGIEQ